MKQKLLGESTKGISYTEQHFQSEDFIIGLLFGYANEFDYITSAGAVYILDHYKMERIYEEVIKRHGFCYESAQEIRDHLIALKDRNEADHYVELEEDQIEHAFSTVVSKNESLFRKILTWWIN